jgi:hypothetical protein
MPNFTRPTHLTDASHFGQRVRVTPVQQQSERLLLGCIDAVITDLLGCKVREAMYDYIAREFSLAREEIPNHLDEFSQSLAKSFGRSAATLERRIERRLYDALDLEITDIPDLSLKEHFERIRSNVDKEQKKPDTYADGTDYSSCLQALEVRLR